jgi:hypothetical protein
MRRCHRGAGNGVDGGVTAFPGREDVEARGKNVVAFPKIREICTLIGKSRGSNSDSLLGSRGRVVARIEVVVTGSDSEVDTSVNGSIYREVEGDRLPATETHIRRTSFETFLTLAFLRGLDFVDVGERCPLNALDHVGHCSRAIRLQDFDSVDVGLLRYTIFLPSNGTRAVSAMAIIVNVLLARRYSLSPVRPTLEIDMIDVGTGVNDIDIDTFAAISGVKVLVEVAKAKAVSV